MSTPPSPPQPRAISGAPPAFPEWMRRLDPVLTREDTNTVFQAFRARRVDHESRRGIRGVAMSPGYLAVLLLGSLLSAALFVTTFILGVFTFLLMIAVLSRGFSSARLAGGGMPRRMAQVCSARGFLEQAAIDLWLAGATGQEVAEAIYLERREQTMRFAMLRSTWLMVLVGVPLVAVFAFAGTLHGAAILAAAVAWRMMEDAGTAAVANGERILEKELVPLMNSWEDGSLAAVGLKSLVSESATRTSEAVIVLLGVLLFGYFVVSVPVGLAMNPGMLDGLSYLAVHGPVFVGAAFCAGSAWVLRLTRRDRIDGHSIQARMAFERAEFPWQVFMAETVLRDPDGRRWAGWRHQWGHAPLAPRLRTARPDY